jgi:hypothetical protein
MQLVMEDALLVVRDYSRPGYASVTGGNIGEKPRMMTLGAAEHYKARYDEKKILPSYPRCGKSRRCHKCKATSTLRCSSCRTYYCSAVCQRREWRRHVFVCNIPQRPNQADNFILLVRRYLRVPPGARTFQTSEFRKRLYLDDDLCQLFGFNNCVDSVDFTNLTCLYRQLMWGTTISARRLQYVALNGLIEENFRAIIVASKGSGTECHCHIWFETVTSKGNSFLESKSTAPRYAHVDLGIVTTLNKFPNRPDTKTRAMRLVLQLYTMLFRDFDNIPDESNSAWIHFGFCQCRSDNMKKRMADNYKKLADVASLQVIATA